MRPLPDDEQAAICGTEALTLDGHVPLTNMRKAKNRRIGTLIVGDT
jgi:hypothetical protein